MLIDRYRYVIDIFLSILLYIRVCLCYIYALLTCIYLYPIPSYLSLSISIRLYIYPIYLHLTIYLSILISLSIYLSIQYRRAVAEWMIDVCDYFQLHPTTTHAAICYLDRLHPNDRYSRQQWQMLAISCILLSCKSIYRQIQRLEIEIDIDRY